jgi:hypothetical protein
MLVITGYNGNIFNKISEKMAISSNYQPLIKMFTTTTKIILYNSLRLAC